MLLGLIGCATPFIPPPLKDLIDRTVTFDQLKEHPEVYQGRIVALGGQILEARNLKEGTLFEILQLPLTSGAHPVTDLVQSHGRFLLLHPGFLDAAIYRKGSFVTIVGKADGIRTRPIGAMEYTYPYLTAEFIHLWGGSSRIYPYDYPYPPFYPCTYPRAPLYPRDPFCYGGGHPYPHHLP